MQCQLCGQTDKYISPKIYGFITDESKKPHITSSNSIKLAKVTLCEDCVNGVAVYSDVYRELESKVSNLRTALEDLSM